jgi:hypothetical protein
MALRDHLGHFRRAEAAPAQSAPEPAFAAAQRAWQEHRQQLAGLRSAITAAGEARRAALGEENWEQVAAIDKQVGELKVRLEGAELREPALGEALTAAQAKIGRAEREALRLQLEHALTELCGDAHRLIAAIERARALQFALDGESALPEPAYCNGWLLARWSDYHQRRVHAEAA